MPAVDSAIFSYPACLKLQNRTKIAQYFQGDAPVEHFSLDYLYSGVSVLPYGCAVIAACEPRGSFIVKFPDGR